MTNPRPGLEPAVALALSALITPTEQGIASRVLVRTAGGTMTLFAFDSGQDISPHTTPFEALALVLEGALTLTIGETTLRATPGPVVRLPASVPHSVSAPEPARLLLVMFHAEADPPTSHRTLQPR